MSKSKRSRVRLTIDYGYDIHWIELSQRTLDRIQSGKQLKLKGQGFSTEERPEQDYWLFNGERDGEIIKIHYNGDEFWLNYLD
jgi:hypothetical protein